MTEKLKPCVIEGCKHNWKKRDGLEAHLYLRHRKSELVKALLKALGL